MTNLILALIGSVGVLAFIGGLGLAVIASADPEGRAGTDALIGLLVAICGVACVLLTVGTSIWRYFH